MRTLFVFSFYLDGAFFHKCVTMEHCLIARRKDRLWQKPSLISKIKMFLAYLVWQQVQDSDLSFKLRHRENGSTFIANYETRAHMVLRDGGKGEPHVFTRTCAPDLLQVRSQRDDLTGFL